ncbi:cupin domain-containing protein, partial [Burkholderia gladioli]|nr:cupin domain-containing protein [Burkholderia gladioli]
IGAQKDLTLREDLPLKVLQHFEPTEDWVLEPGDMLYLPPHIAHDGIAEGECMTCSIGFRAPSAGELTGQFLYYERQQPMQRRSQQQPCSMQRPKQPRQPTKQPKRLPMRR